MPTTTLQDVLGHLRRATLAGSDETDGQLLESFLTGRDELAMETIIRRHGAMVFGVCRRLLGNVHDAEDALQATFLVLVRKAATIRPRENLPNWLYGVAYRTALEARTAAARRRLKERQAGAMPRPETPDEGDRRDLLASLDTALARLPDKFRLPIILCDLEGKTRKEVARQLDWPEGTLSWRLAEGRKQLARRLSQAGVTLAGVGLAAILAETASAVPPALLTGTVRSTAALASGSAALAAVAPAPVAALAEGVLKTMLLSKLKVSLAITLFLAALCAVPGVLGYHYFKPLPASAPPAASGDDKAAPPSKAEQRTAKPEKPSHQAATKHEHHETFVAQHVTSKTFKTGKKAHVIVEMFNGGIEVEATPDATVAVNVTEKTRAATQDLANQALKSIEVTVAQEGDTVRVRARQPEKHNWQNLQLEASAKLRVPVGASLELGTSNGNVSITGGTGPVKAHSSNGAITVKNNRAPLHLRTSNGAVTAIGATGRLDLGTSNGVITIHARKALVLAHTSNGEIHFDGSLVNGKNVFQTSNGSITVALPADAHFQVNAHTSIGRIKNDFGSAKLSGQFGQHLHTSVGENPAVSLELHTNIGSIHIKRQGQQPARQRTNARHQ